MFFIQNNNEDKVYFDGEEVYGAVCPRCGEEHIIVDNKFWEIIEGGSVYDTVVYCDKCSIQRMRELS